MPTWYFTHPMGWIGGSGAVVADTKEKALELANGALMDDPMWNFEELNEEDLHELPSGQAVIITNGEY